MEKAEGQAGAHQTGEIEITEAMVEAGVAEFRAHVPNDAEPLFTLDTIVRLILRAALGQSGRSSGC